MNSYVGCKMFSNKMLIPLVEVFVWLVGSLVDFLVGWIMN